MCRTMESMIYVLLYGEMIYCKTAEQEAVEKKRGGGGGGGGAGDNLVVNFRVAVTLTRTEQSATEMCLVNAMQYVVDRKGAVKDVRSFLFLCFVSTKCFINMRKRSLSGNKSIFCAEETDC